MEAIDTSRSDVQRLRLVHYSTVGENQHGLLQFTLSITFHYILHCNKSQDICCRESFPRITEKSSTTLNRGTPYNKCKAKGQKE